MKIVHSLSETTDHHFPSVLTIGNFDGVHLGHHALLEHLTDAAAKKHGQSVVITFANHPSTILRPEQPVCLLCSLDQRIRLLEQAHIDLLYLLPFTEEFAAQTPEQFLKRLRQVLPFDLLILGSDASIGNQRTGNQDVVRSLAKTMNFAAEYFPDITVGHERISSSRIRELIRQGNFSQVKELLGRPYSIYGPVIKGAGRGASLGIHTANMDVKGICLPPLGVYIVTLIHQSGSFLGVANLGKAPTVRQDDTPTLEVHIIDQYIDLYEEKIEVVFHKFLRPEKRFESIEYLKQQIAQDIAAAKQAHLLRDQDKRDIQDLHD
jgi:riboflavin kinase/FMN adenylyltransferase